MRSGAILCAAFIAMAASGFAVAPAAAQEVYATPEVAADSPTDPGDVVAQPPDVSPVVETDADADQQIGPPLTAEETATLDNALQFNAADPASAQPAKPIRLPGLNDPDKFDVSHTDRLDGSTTLTMKQPLSADDWNAKFGADLNVAAAPSDGYQPARLLPLPGADQDSGTAWASVGVSDLATVDARVDPSSDQGRLGTTIKRSIPVGSKFSVTVQSSYSVTETFSASTRAQSDIPLMTAPIGTSSTTLETRGNENAVKFDILSTGTTFGAGIATASNDPVTHNTLSADQKLFGPLHVTTALTDVGEASAGKKISAGLKVNW